MKKYREGPHSLFNGNHFSSIEAVGKKQYARYHKSVIVGRTNSINDPIT